MSGRGLAVEGQAVAFGANLLYFLNVPQIWFYKVWSGLQKRCEGRDGLPFVLPLTNPSADALGAGNYGRLQCGGAVHPALTAVQDWSRLLPVI